MTGGVMLDWLSLILVSVGCLFMLVGVLGVFRLPDFFSRSHVAGLVDTIAPLFVLAGLLIEFGWDFKLFAIALLLLLINPATTHALCRAALDHLQHRKEGDEGR